MTGAHDMLIVGGGLAGAAFATRLADAGRDVVVIEREAGPHDKVCGEFLSCEALDHLDRLGLAPARLGAVPIDTIHLVGGHGAASRRLPFQAASLSRRMLDEMLLERAQAAGARVLRGAGVARLESQDGGWSARLTNGTIIQGRNAALACGKHDLRARSRPPGLQNDLIGMKTHLRLSSRGAAALDRTVVIGLFEGGYAGLEPIETGFANLCLVVRRARFAALDRDWERLVRQMLEEVPAFGRILAAGEPLHDRPLTIAKIPYGYVGGAFDDALWRLGDQAAVIPSFCGEGMSMALGGARMAADQFLAGFDSRAFQRSFRRRARARVTLAAALSGMIVRAPAQRAAMAACRLMPGLLPTLAAATRIRTAA